MVLVILVVYRQLDKNNRSLEKIRKFAETVRRDLNDFVEERTAAVKDMETVLKVHDKTAAEILRRIQAIEGNLLTRTPELEQMQDRLDRYARSMAELEAQTGRVDANLDRLKQETVFIDRVSQRIKGAGDQMSALEAEFVHIRQEFADINQKDLETIRKNTLDVFEKETFTYVQQLRDAQKQVEGFHAVAAETEKALVARADQVLADTEQQFRRTAREAEDLSSDVFVKLEASIGAQARDAEAQLQTGLEALNGRVDEANDVVQAVRRETEAVKVQTASDLEALRKTVEGASATLKDDFLTEQAQLLTMAAQLKADLEAKVLATRQQAVADAEALRAEFHQSLEAEKAWSQGLLDQAKNFVAEARKASQEGEQKTFEALEARLKDYEATFAYRYGKMEEAEKDIATLDQNLRQAMERVAERIQKDFTAFDEAMAQRRAAEKAALDKEVEASQASLVRLDKDLEELKVRAYDNVSEKLQGFEEEFFEDLQKRTASMAQSLEDWQNGIQSKLEDLGVQAARDRAEVERLGTETMKGRVQELQNQAFVQIDRLEKQIHEAQDATGASVKAFHDDLEATKARLVEELAALEKALEARFDQDRARAELNAGESLTRLERDLETRMKALGDTVDHFQTEYKTALDSTESEFGLWQTKFSQRFKDLDADLGDQYRAFKASLSEKIGALADEFTLQKEELITRSAEDRTALKTDLAQIKAGIEDLDNNLRSRTQAATEAFEREYDAMSQELQKKNRDLVTDIENKISNYRNMVNDTREKAEAMQKKIFGRIEDQVGLLNVSFEEIDKKAKGFVAQTKVFERADTLRQELTEAIEDLKTDLARVEVQRKDLVEIEASIARIKKLGDETSDKAAKFVAEKKRIDLMDSDFQRILSLSQSMEVRLEQVTTSHDLLQDIQLRIRKLEDYSKDIEVRYERLEKRREMLDSTTDGVDRNFALLEKVERAVKGLDAELKSMPDEVEELRKRLKVLAAGKDDAEKALAHLNQLDQTLKDVEGRIGRMEQAREWIAGVENRLTETKAAAEEQVHLLATISKTSGPSAPKGQSTDSEMRQTVLKLARQGWEKDAIARALKLSLGEVELILELGTR